MASEKVTKLIEDVKGLSVLELSELVGPQKKNSEYPQHRLLLQQ